MAPPPKPPRPPRPPYYTNPGYNGITGAVVRLLDAMSALKEAHASTTEFCSLNEAVQCAAMVSLLETTSWGQTACASSPNPLCPNTYCLWIGVTCGGTSGQDVVALDWHGKGMNGHLPGAAFGNLTALTRLDVGGNLLQGTLPPELGALTALTYLDVSSNAFTGELPQTLSSLTALTHLNISSNPGLSGIVPVTVQGAADVYLFDTLVQLSL